MLLDGDQEILGSLCDSGVKGVVVKLFKVFWVLLALFMNPANSAEIRILEKSPITENCLLGKYSAWEDTGCSYYHSCDPEVEGSGSYGMGTPKALRERMKTESHTFYRDGYPKIFPGDDGSGYQDDLLSAAAMSANLGRVIEISGEIAAGDAEKV